MFEPKGILARGFHPVESDDYSLFVWSKLNAKLHCKAGGLLSFSWRSVEGAEVDVFIDGLYDSTNVVGVDWQFFSLQIPSVISNGASEIRLEVSVNNKSSNINLWELGVAIRDVSWTESVGEVFEPKDLLAREFPT